MNGFQTQTELPSPTGLTTTRFQAGFFYLENSVYDFHVKGKMFIKLKDMQEMLDIALQEN